MICCRGTSSRQAKLTVLFSDRLQLNGIDPQAYLADILDRIHDHKINRLDELLPWNWVPLAAAHSQAA
jgi:hypothetical protein